MKTKHLIFTVLSLVCMTIGAQTHRPLVIEGKITNCPATWLPFIFKLESGLLELDTILVDQDGHFYYSTNKVTFPQRTSILSRDIQLNDFFVAPGYHLTITGDGSDLLTLVKSTKIKGAASNRYKELHDSILVARMDMTNWHELKDDSLLQYINEQKHFTDSLEKVVFGKEDTNDPFLSYFGRMTYLDNQFLRLYYLLAGINMKLLDERKAWDFAVEITDKNILENLFSDEYMISNTYKSSFLIKYLDYMVDLDIQDNPSLKDRKYYRLEKLNSLYRGKAKEEVMFNMMIFHLYTMDQPDEYRPVFEKYISEFTNNDYKQSLIKAFQEKENMLVVNQKGNPAPTFVLKDDKGETYSLADFQGKVVYIDLWASWCAPCREEVPALKKIYEKYKSDNRIAIIGIAVHDGYNNWKKALDEDNPEWLQLHDANGVVARLYEANGIPKYILIDKKGNIVDMDAPRPSNSKILEDLLNEEMNVTM